jgi:predicted DNA-binding protein
MPRVTVNKQNFHVPLPTDVYERLKLEAQHLQRPATEVAREAIEVELLKLEAQRVYAEIRAYAEEMGGSVEDIDPLWQTASLETFAQENWADSR